MPQSRERFPTTSWALVVSARHQSIAGSDEALARLCEIYWRPLYAYIRIKGYSVEDAQDLTQGFLARVIDKRYLDDADSDRGRFRTFLLTSLKHFMANEWDRGQAQKRGGGQWTDPLDAGAAEDWYRCEPVDRLTPEKIFERRWAMTLLERTLEQLRTEFAEADKIKRFDVIREFLTGNSERGDYTSAAAELQMTEGALKVAVHRARSRMGELIRDQVAETVAGPEEVQEEIRHLLSALAL